MEKGARVFSWSFFRNLICGNSRTISQFNRWVKRAISLMTYGIEMPFSDDTKLTTQKRAIQKSIRSTYHAILFQLRLNLILFFQSYDKLLFSLYEKIQ